jgi:hypothetical protein
MNDDTVTQPHSLSDGDIGVQAASGTQPAVRFDDGARSNDTAIANVATRSNHDIWAYGDPFTDPGGGIDNG